jgi:hypothetical protein
LQPGRRAGGWPEAESIMNDITDRRRPARIGWILLWLLGVPIPILLILFLIRGCT